MNYIKNKNFWLYIICFMIFWHILNLLYNTFISGRGYQFSTLIDVALALVVALVTGLFFFRNKN